ncbi:MAG: hypothetical protein R3C39_07805 [Dehalococcoidia bacterium]
MSTLLRLLFFASLIAVTVIVVYRPRRLRRYGRRIRQVGYAYVAAILISAALRVLGIVDWS